MATRNITFDLLDGFSADLISELHDFGSDALSIRLVTDNITATTATNFAFTEVTGANYSAGGIACSQSESVSGGQVTIQSAVDFLWSENASGFTNANSAIIYNDTSSRIIGFSDIREVDASGNPTGPVSSAAQDVDINLENGTDLFSIGAV